MIGWDQCQDTTGKLHASTASRRRADTGAAFSFSIDEERDSPLGALAFFWRGTEGSPSPSCAALDERRTAAALLAGAREGVSSCAAGGRLRSCSSSSSSVDMAGSAMREADERRASEEVDDRRESETVDARFSGGKGVVVCWRREDRRVAVAVPAMEGATDSVAARETVGGASAVAETRRSCSSLSDDIWRFQCEASCCLACGRHSIRFVSDTLGRERGSSLRRERC